MKTIKKHRFGFLLAAALLLAFVSLLTSNFSNNNFRSVEFGLAELSPRGEGGGYAMPASGASNPTGLRHSCSTDGTEATLQWDSSTAVTLESHSEQLFSWANPFGLPSAHAFGGGGGGSAGGGGGGGGGSQHGHTMDVSYNLQVDGQSFNGLTTNSHTVSITPDTAHTWKVQSCTGAYCSAWQDGAQFNCPGAPTLDLTADKYVVPYNTGTDLNWTSQRADYCDATGGWTGRKGTSGTEPTGPLKSATNYIMQCTKQSTGQSVNDSVRIEIEYGKCAEMDIEGGSIVRRNTEVTLNWNVGTSDPANCVIMVGDEDVTGPLSEYENTDPNEGTNSCVGDSDTQGSEAGRGGTFDYVVTGETEFTLSCEDGNNEFVVPVKVLPEFQET